MGLDAAGAAWLLSESDSKFEARGKPETAREVLLGWGRGLCRWRDGFGGGLEDEAFADKCKALLG